MQPGMVVHTLRADCSKTGDFIREVRDSLSMKNTARTMRSRRRSDSRATLTSRRHSLSTAWTLDLTSARWRPVELAERRQRFVTMLDEP